MNITIITVPYHLDQLNVGMGLAPDALLKAGLVGRLEALGHQVVIEPIAIAESDAPSAVRIGQLAQLLGTVVARARAAGRFALIIGGDCLVAIGALAGLGQPGATGIVWVDAHGDFNTPETTISGYLGGMPLACVVGRGLAALREQSGLAPLDERHVVLVGVRDLDPQEEQALAGSAVTLVRVDALGAGKASLGWPLGALVALPQLYLHVDIDVLDPAEAPGVDFPTAHGLQLAELRSIVAQAAGLGNLAALSITAVNPTKDSDGRTVRAALGVIVAAFAPENWT